MTFTHCLLAAALVGCVAASDLNFLIVGDWGGQVTPPYTTAAEIATAKQMGPLAESLNSSFTLALGDNFYDHGVKDVDDQRFKSTFEDVFTAKSLFTPWHVLAGNHDHYGNASAEVAYSAKSERWNFPSFYYTFVEQIPNSESTIQFVMIDTVILAGNTRVNGVEYLQPQGAEDELAAETQWEWIESTLSASKAQYIVVAGHYPVYSICEHGPTDLLVLRLKPLLEKYNVTAYICGHDHCAETFNTGTDTDYHVVGASHGCDSSTAHKNAVPKDSLKFHYGDGLGAFAAVTVNYHGFTLKHYSDDGKVLYTAPTRGPRN
jgi:tartrate-resistant acid phosphatase type 5